MVLSPICGDPRLSLRTIIRLLAALVVFMGSRNRAHVCSGLISSGICSIATPNFVRMFAAAILVLTVGGCSTVKAIAPFSDHSPRKTSAPVATPERATPDASSGPSAQIQIDYARADDWLQGVTVREYDGAYLIAANGPKSIVRFEGGTPFWEIEANRGAGTALLSHLGGRENKEYALKSVMYGVVPDGFTQTQPDGLLAQPLQTGHYYVFTVHRGSGSTSHQAIHVDGDGGIEGYDAEPMAGTSFSLCCDVSPGFASSVSLGGRGETSEP
jgi:hypothetical protein